MDDLSLEKSCEVCYRIACKRCDWVASDEEVLMVQNMELTECPKCGWDPSGN